VSKNKLHKPIVPRTDEVKDKKIKGGAIHVNSSG
jgi:hypothetical protein